MSVPSPCYADPVEAAKHTITCELGCRKVIARGDTWDEAEGIAEESGAVYCGGDTGPGEWECAPCRNERYAEAEAEYRQAVAMETPYVADEHRDDPVDALLNRADEMRKSMRENGYV